MWFKVFTACLIILMCGSNAYAEYDVDNLKKLFTDERQRAQIDAIRSGNYAGSGHMQQSRSVKVSGYMTRSDGKSVVWVNNSNTLDSRKIGDIKVHSSIGENKQVLITVNEKNIKLKPGQIWSDATGKIADSK